MSSLINIFSLQIKLWYDKVGHQLIVTILGAKDLPSREDGRPRNPYVKIYFLPDRRYSINYFQVYRYKKLRNIKFYYAAIVYLYEVFRTFYLITLCVFYHLYKNQQFVLLSGFFFPEMEIHFPFLRGKS